MLFDASRRKHWTHRSSTVNTKQDHTSGMFYAANLKWKPEQGSKQACSLRFSHEVYGIKNNNSVFDKQQEHWSYGSRIKFKENYFEKEKSVDKKQILRSFLEIACKVQHCNTFYVHGPSSFNIFTQAYWNKGALGTGSKWAACSPQYDTAIECHEHRTQPYYSSRPHTLPNQLIEGKLIGQLTGATGARHLSVNITLHLQL